MKTECYECGAPAEISEGCGELPGIDFDGAEAIFTLRQVICAAGHCYHVILDEDVVKL